MPAVILCEVVLGIMVFIDVFLYSLSKNSRCHSQAQDAFPFSIGFSTDKGPVCTLSNGPLLRKHHPFPSLKVLSLHRTHVFHMDVYYPDLSELPSNESSKISSFKV